MVKFLKSYWKLVRAITLLGQFGFAFITPPVVMGLLGWWLQSRYGLGTWVMLLCLLIGLMTAFASALRFYRRIMVDAGKKAEAEAAAEKPVVFYRHE